MANYTNPHNNFTPEERAEYEQSRMNYLGMKAVSDTAREERSIEIARKMLKKGFDISTIQELTGLSKEEINELK